MPEGNSTAALSLANDVASKAQLSIAGFVWDSETGRFATRWETGNSTFQEALFAQLALALFKTPRRALHRCAECGQFFSDRSPRPARYCWQSCRSKGSARDFRAGVLLLEQLAHERGKVHLPLGHRLLLFRLPSCGEIDSGEDARWPLTFHAVAATRFPPRPGTLPGSMAGVGCCRVGWRCHGLLDAADVPG